MCSRVLFGSFALLAAIFAERASGQQADILFADFEGRTWGDWKAEGKAFGDGPAAGTLPRQMNVSGFRGRQLVNSFHGGDGPTGTLTSPDFRIERKHISFLIGGGGFAGKTCINLIVDGKVVRTATGQNTRPGGQELLEKAGWDVSDLAGKTARIQIVDDASGGWGHILVDHIVFTDRKPTVSALVNNPSRKIIAEKRLLNLPVRNGAKMRRAKVSVDGQSVREFSIECADADPDWWATLDVSAWRGKTLEIEIDKLPEDSKFLSLMEPGDSRKGAEGFYREALRPQFHFSPSRGWNNDPNGLVFFNGEYHLFFQHNPYGVKWGNMHWGHAVSKDLVHWQEVDIALYPDAMGTMYSGSAVVDWKNTSGFSPDSKPPMVLIYTAAGQPYTQGIAWSADGRSFTKYEQNPVVRHISGGNRDPKVFWHEPSKRWVMALYVDFPEPAQDGKKKGGRQTIHFLTSPDLKQWTVASQIEGFHECPDLLALPVDGDAGRVKWVLTAANSDYMIGSFDGKTFTPDAPEKIKGHRGRGFYAAQTFSDIPSADGRRIMIGWLQTPSPGMPFNQSMSVPLEIKLLSTPEGPRVSYLPAKELESLRSSTKKVGPIDLRPGEDPLAGTTGELLEVRAEFEPAQAAEIALDVRGVAVKYDAQKQEISVNDHKAPAPLRNGRQKLIVLLDRNSAEVFASDGLTYIPFPVIPKDENRSVSISAKGGAAKVHALEMHQLRSMWEK